jgi:hypothetical protein
VGRGAAAGRDRDRHHRGEGERHRPGGRLGGQRLRPALQRRTQHSEQHGPDRRAAHTGTSKSQVLWACADLAPRSGPSDARSSAGEVVATAALPRSAGDGAVMRREFLGAVWVLHRTDPGLASSVRWDRSVKAARCARRARPASAPSLLRPARSARPRPAAPRSQPDAQAAEQVHLPHRSVRDPRDPDEPAPGKRPWFPHRIVVRGVLRPTRVVRHKQVHTPLR